MGLIDLQTNLKSLRYGKDRIHGGNSGQPYIQTSIPDSGGDFNVQGNVDLPGSDDFIIRGGLYAFKDTAQDVLRLGKYFVDLKSPSGLLFIAKQNLLSRTAVRTEASGILNEDFYLPTSTLAQAGVSAFGLHFNKQGLNPVPGVIGSLETYQQAVQYDQFQETNNQSYKSLSDNNRLVALYRVKIIKDVPLINLKSGIKIDGNDPINLFEYTGGPGSILGIGNTKIKLHCGQTRFRNPIPTTDRKDITFEGETIDKVVKEDKYAKFKNRSRGIFDG